MVRQITADILDDNKKSYANELMKIIFLKIVYFTRAKIVSIANGRNLSDEKSAEKFSTVIQSHTKLNTSDLSKARYNLVREMKDNYPIDDFGVQNS